MGLSCEDQYKDRSDPGYAECKRKAGQVQSVDGKEVFIETEPIKKSTYDQVFSEVFKTKEVKTKGGEFEVDVDFDFKKFRENVDTSGGILSDVFNIAKEGFNSFSVEAGYSQDGVETVTEASGIFKQDREEGFKTLQGLTEGIPGFEVKKEKGKGVFLSYTNDKGETVNSDQLYFGTQATEGIEDSSKVISDQKNIIKNFFDKNLKDVDLTEFKKIQKKKAIEQIKAEADFMDSELVENINKKYQSDNLFTEKEGKAIYSMGVKIGNEPNYMPYEKEIEEEIKKINNYIAQNNITSKENTPEKIRKDAENRVRNNLALKEVNEEKALFYADTINNSIEDQIKNTVGSIAVKAVTKDKIVKNESEKQVLIKDQKLNREALEYQSGVLNGTIEADPVLEARYETTLKLLGISSEAEGFVSGMSFDKFLKAGSPKNLEEVTLKNGVQTTRSVLKNQKLLFDQFKARETNYNELIKVGDDLVDTVDDADFVNNLSVKNYNEAQANLRMIGSGFTSMFKDIGYLSAKLLNAGSQYTPTEGSIGMFETNNVDRFLDAMSVNYDKEASLLTERYLNPVQYKNAFKDPLTFGKFMMQEISTQIPIYLTMAATGNVAPIVIGMSSAGSKLSDMKADIAMGEANYSSTDMAFKSFLYGVVEAGLGTVPSVGIIGKNKSRFLKGLKNKNASGLLSQGTKSYVKENFADAFIWEPLTEYATESLTTGFQNLIDGKPFTENIDHAGFSGFSMSLLMSGSSMAVSTYQSRFSSFDQRNSIRKKQQELSSLGEQYKRASMKSPNSRQTKLLEEEINKANSSLNSAIEQSNEVVNNNLRAGHAEGVNQILATQTQMQTDAQTILSSTTLTDTEKQLKIDALQNQYKLFESIKQSSLSKQNMMKYRPEFKLMQANDSDRYNNLLLEAEKSIESDKVTPEAIKRVAYEMYLKEEIVSNNNQASKIKDFKLVQHNTIDDAIVAIEESSLSDDDKSMAINNVRRGADGWADANGIANVVIDNQVENQRKHVATHEIGHLAFWQIFKDNEAAFKPIANQLLSSVKDVNPKLYNEFVNDVERDENGYLKSQEVIMRFLEFAADGKMDPKKNALQGFFGTILQKSFSKEYNFDFKGESDITSFVTELGKKIKDGTLSKADIQAASKNVSIVLGQGPVDTKTGDIVFSTAQVNDLAADAKKSGNLESKDLKNQYELIALNALGYQPGKGTVTREDAVSFVNQYLPGIIRRYNPDKNFSTFVDSNIRPKKQKFYQQEIGDAAQTTSIDSPQAQQVADTTTETETKIDTKPIIDVMNFAKKADSSIDVKQFEKDFTDGVNKLAQEKGIDITSPNLTSKQLQAITPYDVLAKAIGIPANKLSNPKDNLSKSESLKAQRILLMAKPFIKNVVLGQANKQVQTVASKKKGGKPVKLGGESLGLGRNILKTFFNPPKRVGNNQVRTPKKFENSIYEAAIGVKDGKVDPNYVPRASESQIIKGLLKGVAEQMANRGARNILDTKTQTSNVVSAKANLERGKSKLMFSIAPIQKVSKKFRDDLRDFQSASEIDLGNEFRKAGFELKSIDYVKSDGTIGRETRFIKDNSVAGKKFKKARSKWIKSIASELHPSILEASLIAGGPRSMFGTLEDVYKALGVKTKAEAIKLFNQKSPVSPKNTIYSRGKNAKMTPSQFKAFTKTDAFKENEKLKLPYLKHFATVMQNSILNDTSGDITAMWAGFMKASDSMSSGIIRRNAPIKFFSNIAAREGNLFVEEHSMPSNNVAKYLFYSALQGKVDANFGFIKDNYFQGQLRKLDDKKMKGTYFNYIAKMPAAFYSMNNLTTWARYNNPDVNNNNGGIDFDSYQMVGTDITVSQEMSKYKELAQQGQAVVLSNIKKDNVLENGKQAIENNTVAMSVAPDPDVLDTDINQMIQDTKGIDAVKRFSDIVAKRRGAKVRNFKLISSGAQDFQGLMYDLYGKGRKGEQQQKWVQDNLVKPYQKGIADIDKYRQALKNDYATLLKQNPEVAKKLSKIIPGTEFTFDQALRVNLWTRAGFEIPGLSKRDIKILDDTVIKDPLLSLFNDSTLLISKRDKWVEPSAYWDSESLISDLNNLTNKVGRKQYLAEFIQNADVIFSKENLNKMEVALGTNWREAMEDSLYRMKNGTNRPSGTNKLTNQFNNWVNNSIGAIMFFNRKSALLQTISSVNFLNWSDNNPFKAALAFANQPQYWSDFATLWNSPKLKQRRSGLRKDVNEAELANAAKGALNKPQAILSYLLKIGFTPTQLADSFAIASGGATFYRNRLNTYKKQGMSETDAADKAFEDFSSTSDVSQQSADPMLISQQQASTLGRLLLAFQNTPAQVTRIFNKSARDFINGRGDQKTNVSKMLYYGAVQGMIFATLQNALFAAIPGFDDEDDEEKRKQTLDKKEERILNSMVDTMLRGSGIYGAIVATMKNTIMAYFKEEKKDAFGKDHRNTLLEALNLSPPVGSKLRKINNAIKAKDYNKEVIKEQGWDVTLKGKVNLSPSYQVIASLAEAITNLPLERAVVEIDAIVETLDSRNSTFQRIALALGYRTWDVGTKNEERDLVKIESKEAKEKARKQKVIDDRAERKRLKELEKYKGKTKEEIKQMKRRDSIVDTNKSDQVKSLINLGLTKKEIKELKYEDDRVNKIIELTNK